jgi:hypothetical protein
MTEQEKSNYEKLLADAEIMALRLMGEDFDSFSPECREVMMRWKKHLIAKLILNCE